MAHIYTGDLNSVDPEVLAAMKSLPDDFWAFAGFQIGREVDWFIARTTLSQEHSPLIVTELKRYERSIKGTSQDSPWEYDMGTSGWQFIESDRDRNPYWQAVNTANALNIWLWNNQNLYLEHTNGEPRPLEDFRAWPHLLILSPPGVRHFLPLRPTSRFGSWFFQLDHWLDALLTWRPRQGIGLSELELRRLAEALGLSEVYQPPAETPPAPPPAKPVIDDQTPTAFSRWLIDLVQQMQDLSQRIARLEAAAQEPAGREEMRLSISTATALRPLTPEEKQAIVQAVEDVAKEGKSRAMPTVISAMERYLGYSLKTREYNGYGRAAEMFNEAMAEGVVKFGPRRGPNLTVYLPHELVPLS